jgi:hypothetical protein
MADLMNTGGVVIDGHPNRSAPLTPPAIDDLDLGSPVPMVTCEPSLGNPPVDDYVLSSKQDGTRQWVAPVTGGTGAVNPYEQIKDLVAGTTRFTTPLTTQPSTITLFEPDGADWKIIHNMETKLIFTGGVYVVDVYSVDPVAGVKLKIVY